MRLFEVQGYASTTVEQIALAAEISTATFYRYYCNKEDIVFGNDDQRMVEEVVAGRPASEPLATTIGALFRRLAAEFEQDREAVIARMRLVNAIPDLQARRWLCRQRTAGHLARLLAPRAGRHPDDHELRLAITVALAAESETLCHWARIGGACPLSDLLDQALARITPVFQSLAAGAA